MTDALPMLFGVAFLSSHSPILENKSIAFPPLDIEMSDILAERVFCPRTRIGPHGELYVERLRFNVPDNLAWIQEHP